MVPALEAGQSKQTFSFCQERGMKKGKMLKRTLEWMQDIGYHNTDAIMEWLAQVKAWQY